jgi:hypothetical protein
MNLIDDVNLERAVCRLIANVLNDLANLIDSAIGGAVDFDNIDTASLNDFSALNAFVTWSWRRTLSAIQCLGENPSRRCFADPANPGKQISVSYTARSYGILQGASDMTLPRDIFKVLRTPLTRED